MIFHMSWELSCCGICKSSLTRWGRVTHICASKLTIIGLDNGLLAGRSQAIIWTNAGILLMRTSGTNFSEILSEIHTFSLNKMHSFRAHNWKSHLLPWSCIWLSNQVLILHVSRQPNYYGICKIILKHSSLCNMIQYKCEIADSTVMIRIKYTIKPLI